MVYQKKSNEELAQYPYPNLMAELIESGYSICTLADHMGMGAHREEDDQEVWDKLAGHREILASEALGLARLFGAKIEYLLSHDLKIFGGAPMACLQWYDENKRKEREYREYRVREEIICELKKKPYLLDFIKQVRTWNEEELQWGIKMLSERKEAAACRE